MNERMAKMEKARILEQRCYDIFAAMGWKVSCEWESPFLDRPRSMRPDIELLGNNGIVGCVEIKTYLDEDIRKLRSFIERIRYILTEWKPTFFIFTNGYIFELYLEGEYYGQLTFLPSPEDIEILLKSRKGDN